MLCSQFYWPAGIHGFWFYRQWRSQNDSSIPPFANLITLPQFLLGGTFFFGGCISFLASADLQGTAAHAPEYRYAQWHLKGKISGM